MSSAQNTALCAWDKLFKYLKGACFVRKGQPLSQQDKVTWSEALTLLGLLLTDSNLSCSTNQSSIIRWVKNLTHYDVIEVVKTLKDIDQTLVRYIGHRKRRVSFNTFKQYIKSLHPNTTSSMLSIFRGDITDFLDDGVARKFTKMHTAFNFISRVNFVDIHDDDPINEFVQRDNALPDVSYSGHYLFKEMNKIARRWFADFRVVGQPRHSGGSTADAGRSIRRKYQHIASDPLLDYVLRRSGYNSDDYKIRDTVPWERVSSLALVPKTALTPRIICAEPATLQFFQHLVQKDLYDYFSSNKWLSRHIKLEDQSINRMMALEGSITGQLATVDLSAASDYVSWALVKQVFKGTTLLPWLYALRSRHVRLPSGELHFLKKHAPMGSAMCFPIMCAVFAILCEYIVLENGLNRASSRYQVYGDDIICSVEMIPALLRYLKSLGFVVNTTKTFTDPHINTFRESCGIEAWGGYDITPTRISRKFLGGALSPDHPSQIATHIEFANALYDAGYYGCRLWIIRKLLSLPVGFVPQFGGADGALKTNSADYCHRHPIRWNKNYQRWEARCGVVTSPRLYIHECPVKEHGRLVDVAPSSLSPKQLEIESMRYLEYWITTIDRHSEKTDCRAMLDDRIRVEDPEPLYLMSKWLPIVPIPSGIARPKSALTGEKKRPRG